MRYFEIVDGGYLEIKKDKLLDLIINEIDFEEKVIDELNEEYIEIWNLTYAKGDALKQIDPIALRCAACDLENYEYGEKDYELSNMSDFDEIDVDGSTYVAVDNYWDNTTHENAIKEIKGYENEYIFVAIGDTLNDDMLTQGGYATEKGYFIEKLG